MSEVFGHVDTLPPTRIWDGVLARFVVSELITMAIVELEPESVVREHRHVNEQLGFVVEGSITFTVDGETRTVGPGGTWRILADVPHRAQAGPRGATVAEVYSPVRADWAALGTEAPTPARWPSGAG